MCASERCQLMNTNMRNVHAVRNMHPFTEYDVLGGIILTLMFWKLHMHDANKTKADCKVTIFKCRNSRYHDTFAIFYKLENLTLIKY